MVIGPSRSLDTLRQFQVDVCLDGSLRISHNKIDLTKSPTEDDAHDDHKSDCKPRNNRSVGLIVIHAVDLLSSMKIQPGLVLGDLVGGEIALASHGPHWWDNLGIFRYILKLDELPMIVLHVAIHFFDNGFGKLMCIWLLKCLMVIHDAAHHFGMKSNGVPHPPLKIQVLIME